MLVWAKGADLSSSRCCQSQEGLHSSGWNLKFHLLQLPMWRGGHHKILLAPFWWPEHLKSMKPLEMAEPDASLTFQQWGPGGEPAATSTCLTVRGDVQTGFSCWLRLWKHSKKLLSSAEHHLWAPEEQQNKSATEAHRGVWGTCSVQSCLLDYLLKAGH